MVGPLRLARPTKVISTRLENQKPGAGAGLLLLLALGVGLLDARLSKRIFSRIASAFATRPKP
jgi:hypothetical protein